jgi:hypothetical protein
MQTLDGYHFPLYLCIVIISKDGLLKKTTILKLITEKKFKGILLR